mmetsp:Transcript_3010/g.3865  ORF Transcript_3010/g.3865 Transcript_3010/m.3865 type:complete len:288 (+) Transcript_3010:62-925(+)
MNNLAYPDLFIQEKGRTAPRATIQNANIKIFPASKLISKIPVLCGVYTGIYALLWIAFTELYNTRQNAKEVYSSTTLSVARTAATALFTGAFLSAMSMLRTRKSPRLATSLLTLVINLLAGVTHLAMALRLSPVFLSHWGRFVPAAFYCEWLTAVPLMILLFCHKTRLSSRDTYFLMLTQGGSLFFGLLGSVIQSWAAYLLLIISGFCTIPFLLRLMQFAFSDSIRNNYSSSERCKVGVLVGIFMAAWLLWPSFYICGMTGIIAKDVEIWYFTLLDTLTKLSISGVV